jgi:iron(III) transport system ATP-binding protein
VGVLRGYACRTMPTAIAIEQVVKSFGSGPAAVAGVDLAIAPGELFFLLGPSGCGKTTLLRMIAGFTEPTSGRIVFKTEGGDRDVTNVPPNKRNTGMVFQSYALWPHMTVAGNVAFGLEVRKVGREELASRVREALDIVQMGQYADRKPNQLSGGQQQRVALARALVVRPDVLLLDEPLSNLDAKLRVELRSEIRRICKTARAGTGSAGITTVYVTHDQKEALSMADRVAIMSAGSVVQMGTPGELYRRPANTFVAEFLGETNFIEAEVGGAVEGGTGLNTAVGSLVSQHAAPGGAVMVSLRPEALRVESGAAGSGRNRLEGRLVESTYLGELAQYVVELKGTGGGWGNRVKVAVLNPGGMVPGVGSPVWLSVDPADVVMVPKGGTMRRT